MPGMSRGQAAVVDEGCGTGMSALGSAEAARRSRACRSTGVTCSRPSAYNNFVAGFPAGISDRSSASKADLFAQIQAAACEVRGGWNMQSHLWWRGSDLQPESLVISLLSSSSPSKHSSYLTASVGLVPALWIIARQ